METAFSTIKSWLSEAEALVISTGAGMGVDSGLADYRGNGGQWGQVEHEAGKSIFEVVNPQAFLDNPAYSWALFGARMQDYARTEPHRGFRILKDWTERYGLDCFCLTSNIDGHLQKAGFEEDRIRELHGSLAYFQCADPKASARLWPASPSGEEIVAQAAQGQYPTCPYTGLPARPNVYMFRDYTFVNTRTKMQEVHFQEFLERNRGKRMLVIEIGSGPHVQSIRMKTRMLRKDCQAHVLRINPKDYRVAPPGIGLAMGALEALTALEAYLAGQP
jgi:NAD-dependent SIR2 family protein deacetylase